MRILSIIMFVIALFMAGCGSLPAEYVEADDLTLQAVGPDYAGYFEADATLTDDQKQSKRDVLASWTLRVAEAKKKGGK